MPSKTYRANPTPRLLPMLSRRILLDKIVNPKKMVPSSCKQLVLSCLPGLGMQHTTSVSDLGRLEMYRLVELSSPSALRRELKDSWNHIKSSSLGANNQARDDLREQNQLRTQDDGIRGCTSRNRQRCRTWQSQN